MPEGGKLSSIAKKKLQRMATERHVFWVSMFRLTVKWGSFMAMTCIVWISSAFSYHLGMLGEDPDWSALDSYQRTMTREEFVEALETVYLPYGFDEELITIYPGYALIRKDSHRPETSYRIDFSAWKDPSIATSSETIRRSSPLEGVVIAIDPGHIGGAFSEMERRHFQIGLDPVVKEGDLTLIVAKKLEIRLAEVGAKPVLLRTDTNPVTEKRPGDFYHEAVAIEQQFWLEANNFSTQASPWETEWFKRRVEERMEMLFYRVSEIQARARLINESIRPDLTIAVHFNVAPWKESTRQVLPEVNHMHILVHGTYMPAELALDDVRFHLFRKLLSRNHEVEIPLSSSVANTLLARTGLRPFTYAGKNASNQGGNQAVWARNLLANRLYDGPVVFLEAYCTNSVSTYNRVQIGDYEGLREIEGEMRLSLFNEYVEGVVEGLVDYYRRQP